MGEQESCHTNCLVHPEIVEIVTKLNEATAWIKRIGSWILSALGTIILLLVPLVVSFFVYFSKMDTRVAKIEYRLDRIETAFDKSHKHKVP